MVVTISRRGYIKRQPVATYRRQGRGGKGIIGHVTREEDAVDSLLVANTHDWGLFFTNRGRVFSAKVHAVVDASRQAKGIPIINLPGVQVEAGEVPTATLVVPDFKAGRYLVMATRRGVIKKTPLEQFEKVRSSGIRAITLADDDELAWVGVAAGHDDVIIATALGKLARFAETEVRAMGRDAAGVIGIRLARAGDEVVSMSVVQPERDLLVLTETGYGKRVALSEFRRKHRGGQGVMLIPLEGRRRAAWRPSSRSPRPTRSSSSSAPAARWSVRRPTRSTGIRPAPAASSRCASMRVIGSWELPPSVKGWRSAGAWATMAIPTRDPAPGAARSREGVRRGGGARVLRLVRRLHRE